VTQMEAAGRSVSGKNSFLGVIIHSNGIVTSEGAPYQDLVTDDIL